MKYPFRLGFVALVALAGACGDDVDNDDNGDSQTPDARVDATPTVDGPTADGPTLDGPGLDAPLLDAPLVDAPLVDAPLVDAMVDAPTDGGMAMVVQEIEPNEDGTPSLGGSTTNGNDYASANAIANGALLASGGAKHVEAALTPEGDEDVFAIKNDGAVAIDMRIDLYNLGTGFGYGVACGGTTASADTVLTIRDAAGAPLAQNDDRDSTTDRCSGLTYTIAAGATVFAHVIEYGDNAVIAAYGAQIAFNPIVCGDNHLSSTEQCDDGNVVPADGCSATCTLEGVTDEVEPNETTAQATTNAPVTADAKLRGTLATPADVDTYRLTVTTATVVRLETLTSVLPADCLDGSTDLRLLDSAGAALYTDTSGASGIEDCGAIVAFLQPGTYFVEVKDAAAAANTPYFVDVDFVTSSGTESEVAGTTGTNDSILTASLNFAALQSAYVFGDHTLSADGDYYAINVPAGAHVRAEVIEGGATTCESNQLDSRVTLFDAAGTQLVDDDDSGRGFCSLIDGTGTNALDPTAGNATAAPALYYVKVSASGTLTTPASMFTYRLAVTIR